MNGEAENDIPFEAVESELAEKIEPAMDEHGAAEHMYTRTLGELYFSQRVLVRALKVFQHLQEQELEVLVVVLLDMLLVLILMR